MIYADYEYYFSDYYGSKIPETEFNYYASRASDELDSATFGRITEVTPAVKKACCAVAEALYSSDASSTGAGAGISSEKVGDYSVTYSGSTAETEEISKSRVKAEIKKYLGNTGLLYKGVV